jgi:uncharacterized protein YneF (UPF0154 family)
MVENFKCIKSLIHNLEIKTNKMVISTVIGGVIGYLATNKSVQELFKDLTAGAVNEIRPIFLKESGEPQKVLADLQANPKDELNTQMMKLTLEKAVRDNPKAEEYLKEIYNKIEAKSSSRLVVDDIEAKTNITFEAEQKNSEAGFRKMKAEDGEIKITIKQK